MGKRSVLALTALVLTVGPATYAAPAGAITWAEPSCAELACRMCRVLTDAATKLSGDEPGYCAA